MSKKNKKQIKLEEVGFLTSIPKNTIAISLKADVYMNGKIMTVTRKIEPDDVRVGVQSAEDYCDDVEQYTLTEEGKRYLEELIKRGLEEDDEV